MLYCGYKKKILENVTLRDVLKEIPDSLLDSKLTILNSGKFYLHFDIEGGCINLDTRPWNAMYNCKGCEKSVNNNCTCDGSNCMNYEAYFNSDKNILGEDKKEKNSSSVEMSINGVPIFSAENINKVPVLSDKDMQNDFSKDNEKSIEKLLETAVENVLTKILNSIKEDK